jgi:YVTN family beta-propeller protein
LPDYVLNVLPTPDGKRLIALNCGHGPHGINVLDVTTLDVIQRVELESAWLGLAWSPDGRTLYVSGGNGESRVNPTAAPVYAFGFDGNRLTEKPTRTFKHRLPAKDIYWSSLLHHPTKPILYAAHRGTQPTAGHVVAFDSRTGEILAEYPTGINPYGLALDAAHETLFVSNWGDQSITALDLSTGKTRATIPVGHNPCDLRARPRRPPVRGVLQ